MHLFNDSAQNNNSSQKARSIIITYSLVHLKVCALICWNPLPQTELVVLDLPTEKALKNRHGHNKKVKGLKTVGGWHSCSFNIQSCAQYTGDTVIENLSFVYVRWTLFHILGCNDWRWRQVYRSQVTGHCLTNTKSILNIHKSLNLL